jgi:hypothetical protein
MNRAGIQSLSINRFTRRLRLSRGMLFGMLIIGALLSFEVFNYSTTDFALGDLLGGLDFAGIRWATILAVAFCGIDFAGIARLFTPEQGADEPKEVWYLFGAWLLAATMNAMLTWWGVSVAILNHQSLGNAVIDRETMIKVVPVFVALMVWLIRILIIGTFSVAGERLFTQAEFGANRRISRPLENRPLSRPLTSQSPAFRPAPKASLEAERGNSYVRQEPTYHPVSMSGYANRNSQTRR